MAIRTAKQRGGVHTRDDYMYKVVAYVADYEKMYGFQHCLLQEERKKGSISYI